MNTTKKTIFDYTLYKLLWKKNLCKKIIYALIPFILIGTFGLILYFSGAWNMEGYSFLADYTNCFMLCYIFFFMYFVHGLFLPYFHRQVDLLGAKTSPSVHRDYGKNIKFANITVAVCSLLIAAFAIPFIYFANESGDSNWYSKLNNVELIYYSVLIVMSWVMSARLFATILIDVIAVYKYLQHPVDKLDYYNLDKKCGLKGLYNSLTASLGFGFYFLIAVAVIIYSDYHAHKYYGLDLLAYQYRWLIVFVTVILAAIYYTVIIITYSSLNKVMKTAIKKKIMKAKVCDKQNKFLRNICSSIVTLNDVFIFVISVLFPGIAAILQIFSPL